MVGYKLIGVIMHQSGIAILSILLAFTCCKNQTERSAWHDLDQQASMLNLSDSGGANNKASSTPEEFTPDQSTDLNDYLYYAGMHHPGLRAAFHQWQASLEQVPQSNAWPDPQLSYGYFLREVETRLGPQEQKFGLMQKIPWPAKLSQQGDVALRRAMKERYLFEGKKLQLFFEVKRAYYEYDYLARSIAVVEDNLKLLEQMEASVRSRYKAGAVQQPALIQTQVELGKLEDRLKSIKALRPALEAKLNLAIGWDVRTRIPWPEISFEEPPSLEEEALLMALLEDNPALEAAREEIQVAQAQKELSQEAYWPDLTLGATYIQTGRRSDANPRHNGEDPVLLSLEISLPLWQSRYDAGAREADARFMAVQAMREDMINRLSADLSTTLYLYEEAGRKVELFQDTLVPKAEQALKTSQSAFASGAGGFLEVIDAERQLLEFRLLKARAQADRSIRFAELEMLCGRSLRR
ncbi:MAG: TolC family protein [Planctomycetes bacterium]|nr:TolC family protein [Planctomycetota bacterium]